MAEEPIERIEKTIERVTKLLAGMLLKDIEDGNQNVKIARLRAMALKIPK